MKTLLKRALMIGAHPDDCEIKTSGTALQLVKNGFTVKFVAMTNGETGHFAKGGAELALIRKAEMEKACNIAGVDCQIFDIKSNLIQADIQTRERVIGLIREFQPDIIFTHRTNDYHPDHRQTALLVQDSSYAIRVPNVCPHIPCLRYSPIIVYMYDNFTKPVPFNADIVINIDDFMKKKTEIIDCHVSQMYEWDPWMENYTVPTDPGDRLVWMYDRLVARFGKIADMNREKLIDKYGEAGKNIKCIEAFEISEYSKRPSQEELEKIFSF